MILVERASAGVFVLMSATLCLALYFWLHPPALVSGSLHVMDVDRDRWMRYHLSVCQQTSRDVVVHVFREIELVPDDGLGVINLAPPGAFVIDHVCEDREFLVQLPPVEPGRYLLRLTTITDAAPFASTQRVWTSAPFEVAPP